MNDEFIEQYKELWRRENANTRKLHELGVKLDAIGKIQGDPETWECPERIALYQRMDGEWDAEFKEWQEEDVQIKGEILRLMCLCKSHNPDVNSVVTEMIVGLQVQAKEQLTRLNETFQKFPLTKSDIADSVAKGLLKEKAMSTPDRNKAIRDIQEDVLLDDNFAPVEVARLHNPPKDDADVMNEVKVREESKRISNRRCRNKKASKKN